VKIETHTVQHTDQPVHLLAQAGDRKALCGAKDPTPVCVASFAQRHIDGHRMVPCPECWAAWHACEDCQGDEPHGCTRCGGTGKEPF
jgi:hypothetical protein